MNELSVFLHDDGGSIDKILLGVLADDLLGLDSQRNTIFVSLSVNSTYQNSLILGRGDDGSIVEALRNDCLNGLHIDGKIIEHKVVAKKLGFYLIIAIAVACNDLDMGTKDMNELSVFLHDDGGSIDKILLGVLADDILGLDSQRNTIFVRVIVNSGYENRLILGRGDDGSVVEALRNGCLN